MQNDQRRNFIKTMVLGGAALQIPFIFSCNSEDLGIIQIKIEDNFYTINTTLFKEIVDILFPKTIFSPSASDFKADIYYLWVLNDSNINVVKRQSLVKNIEKIDGYCKEYYKKSFLELNKFQKKEAIKKISMEVWGENYLSRLMTLIIEAMFANSIYGSNPENIGRNWLNFKGGYPQPTAKNRYPEILKINHIQDE
jgi:gluconate 2-dehydrogenase gamma chain